MLKQIPTLRQWLVFCNEDQFSCQRRIRLTLSMWLCSLQSTFEDSSTPTQPFQCYKISAFLFLFYSFSSVLFSQNELFVCSRHSGKASLKSLLLEKHMPLNTFLNCVVSCLWRDTSYSNNYKQIVWWNQGFKMLPVLFSGFVFPFLHSQQAFVVCTYYSLWPFTRWVGIACAVL